MGTQLSSNATLLAVSPPKRVEQGEYSGRVHVLYDEFQPVATVVANAEVIKFQPLPAGARVIDVQMSFSDQGTTGTAKLGWLASADAVEAADDDGFLATIDMKAAANTVCLQDEAAIPGYGKKFASSVQPALTMTEATDASSTTVPWKLVIEYVLD